MAPPTTSESLNFLQKLTSSLPYPIPQLGEALIGPQCYKTLILDVNPEPECLKHAVSKVLGVGIIAGGSIVKVPQILNILKSRSTKGLSFSSYALDTASLAITVGYNLASSHPFVSYGESFFLLLQNAIILYLLLLYTPPSSRPLPLLTYLLVLPTLFTLHLLPPSLLRAGLGFTIPLSLSSKLPQISTIYQQRSAGQLSTWLVVNSLVGCLARVFTTAQETGDRIIWWSFVAAAALNAVILGEVIYYGSGSGGEGAKVEEKRKKE
ncbi:mannose-P-dolichol utilization defect 1 protein [Atractiella rhizophila]|nr:mannose-P-dolichol utilization defect 1 protein [Atractiella rhizophila]